MKVINIKDMEKDLHKTGWAALLIVLFSACANSDKKLPFLTDSVVERQVNGKTVTDTVYRKISNFSFLNQDSILISNKNFDGKIYVADFFFTSCPTICPVMHRNLMKVFQKYKGNPAVMLLSHTIDYRHDLPSKLKAYRHKLGADGPQWQYVWGERNKVYQLAQKDYLVSVIEDKNSPGGYVHQGYLVLIDKNRRVRGAYDGTVSEQVDQLMTDMDLLLKEE